MKRTPLESWICAKIGAAGPDLARADLEAYQLEQLNITLQLAARSSFYRRRLAGCPTRLESLEAIAGLPFTTAGDLRGDGVGMVCVSQSEIKRVVTLDTSGTTGAPKRLYFTRADQELTIDFFHHGMSTFTRPGDRVLILLPYERPGSVGDLLAIGLRRLGATPVPYGPVLDAHHALSVIQTEKITGLVGAPTHVLALARFSSVKPQAWTPAQVLLSTDTAAPALVAAIRPAWGCDVYDHYGMTETGLGGGVDCQARTGYHLREADLYVEIVDPHTGRPVPDGQRGEAVITTLTRQGMPLIRYHTGDESRFLTRPCPCGTSLKTLQHMAGRYSGRVRLTPDADDTLSISDLDDALFRLEPVLNFSAVVRDHGQRTILEIELVHLPGVSVGLVPAVECALDDIPAVQTALCNGRLDVQLSARPYDPSTAGSLAKRKIIDTRSGRNA